VSAADTADQTSGKYVWEMGNGNGTIEISSRLREEALQRGATEFEKGYMLTQLLIASLLS